jgi:hypothetical protein
MEFDRASVARRLFEIQDDGKFARETAEMMENGNQPASCCRRNTDVKHPMIVVNMQGGTILSVATNDQSLSGIKVVFTEDSELGDEYDVEFQPGRIIYCVSGIDEATDISAEAEAAEQYLGKEYR